MVKAGSARSQTSTRLVSYPVFDDQAPSVIPVEHRGDIDCDIAIVGAGIGGATLAWALRDCRARVLVIEQGDFLPRERENWSPRSVHRIGRYKNSARWVDGESGDEFVPGNYHYVGGSSKFYGASMPRFRECDFGEVALHDGVSPAWPIDYATMEAWYGRAEELYWVHGGMGDPTEPPRAKDWPFPAVEHEPPIEKLAARLARQGLHPFPLPLALDWRAGGACVLCRTCDSYPCMVDAKGDADVCAMRPALRSPSVKLLTRAEVRRVVTDAVARNVTGLELIRDGQPLTVRAERYVIAAGAVNTAALLLRSRSAAAPRGVANSSDQVGRNYMAHVSSFVVGARPGRAHHMQFEKTLGINDWYHAGPGRPFPLGNVQGLGKLFGETIKPARRWVPLGVLEWITRRSVDLFVETEDLPRSENRVAVDGANRIHLHWRPTNLESHRELVKLTGRAVRRAGYPFIFTQELGVAATSHQCGTARMGEDSGTSVVGPDCRSHDVRNLWIVDASVFPSSAAVNPALTVAATALRVAAEGGLVPSRSHVAAIGT
jgi:choline dehydrogenase-like flavoprotein